jgi:hypothetical protein
MFAYVCNGYTCEAFSRCFSVLDICFKCFVCLRTYVASVTSGCLKSRSGVVSLSLLSDVSPQCLLLLLASAGHWPSPLPLVDVGDVRGDTDPAWAREIEREIDCKCGLPNAPSVQT